MEPGISIVIPVHNGAAYLEACLKAVRSLRPQPLECIVVDDGSTDGSAQVARAAGATVISTPGRRGPAFARNRGAAAARGEILLFVDADVVVPPDTLARLAARFSEDPSRDAVIGSYDFEPASPSLLSQYRNLLHCYTHQRGQTRTCGFWTGCGAIRKAVFCEHGGFDQAYTRPCMEDLELGMRLRQAGRQIWLDKELQVKHLKRLRFWRVMKTDIVDRAIPWTRLILRSHRMPADLNLKWGQRFSVLASGWTALAAVLSAVFAASAGTRFAAAPLALSAALAAFAVAALNRDFYRFLARVRSPGFAFAAFPLHCLYFLCGGAGFAAGLAAHGCALCRRRLFPPEPQAGRPLCTDPPKHRAELAKPPATAPSCPAAPPNV
jgi:glycosyltransferase involved in cell wall biosynthesis